MQLPYSDVLNIAHFSRLFDNKSECCKLFWFQAIARKMKEGHKTISFEILIDEMIADAWYMVSEYHLNLGPNDALERVVHRLSATSHMKSSEKKEVYYFLQFCGLNTQIQIQKEWADYIERNYEIIQGWIELNLIQYLQRRNPSVPGIVDKLFPPKERNLEKVKKYWKMIVAIKPVCEIYGEKPLNEKIYLLIILCPGHMWRTMNCGI